jgi:hypothetical protein
LEEETIEKKNMITSSRFGLTLKNKENQTLRIDYILKLYRYITFAENIKKGKCQIACTEFFLNKTKENILKSYKFQKKSLDSYLKNYAEGMDLTSPNSFIGTKIDTDDMCKMHGYLLNKK